MGRLTIIIAVRKTLEPRSTLCTSVVVAAATLLVLLHQAVLTLVVRMTAAARVLLAEIPTCSTIQHVIGALAYRGRLTVVFPGVDQAGEPRVTLGTPIIIATTALLLLSHQAVLTRVVGMTAAARVLMTAATRVLLAEVSAFMHLIVS